MGTTFDCNHRQLVRDAYKPAETIRQYQRYPVRERHPFLNLRNYLNHVSARRGKKVEATIFVRIIERGGRDFQARTRTSIWLENAEKTFNRIARLEANWDGYRAKSIDPDVVAAAKELIAIIAEKIEKAPTIVPTSGGAIQLEWHHGSRCLELEFESPNMIHYLKWDPASGTEEEDFVTTFEEEKISSLLRWFENQ